MKTHSELLVSSTFQKNPKGPGIAPRQMAKKTVSTDSDYTFFMFVSSKRIKYGWFKKSSKSKLFRGNGKVNETERDHV